MTSMPSLDREELVRRISRDLADSYDEELEMEIEDREHLPPGVAAAGSDAGEQAYRRQYFSELFRLQAELVKLRFFGGLSVAEAASCLGIARATADRHWAYARAWLFDRLRDKS